MPQITLNNNIFKIYYVVNNFNKIFKYNIKIFILNITKYKLLKLDLICNQFDTFYHKILIKIYKVNNSNLIYLFRNKLIKII